MWQTDITCVATKKGWLYVAGVLDACSRRIVGWATGDTMPTALVARVFERAVQGSGPPQGYYITRTAAASTPATSTALLHRHGVVSSMGRTGNCDDQPR